MSKNELIKYFRDAYNGDSDEVGDFDKIPLEARYSQRPDLHAFILLDKILPDTFDIVSAAEHDEIWLGVNLEALASVITPEQIIDLVRCGVRIDAYGDGLGLYL